MREPDGRRPTRQASRGWLLALLLALPGAGAAAEARYFGGLELGYSTYRFDEKIDQNLVFSTANLTAGVALGAYSILANYAFSFAPAEMSEEDFVGEADRTDLDLIVSRRVTDALSLFVGYKIGETELDSILRDDEDAGGPRRDEYFRQSGLFVGASYTWAFEDAGRLSLSLAYADLDAENRFEDDGDGPDPGDPPEFDDVAGKQDADSSGYSFNLTWTQPLKGNLLYRAKLRMNSYEQAIDFQGQRFANIEERSTALLTGLVYVF